MGAIRFVVKCRGFIQKTMFSRQGKFSNKQQCFRKTHFGSEENANQKQAAQEPANYEHAF
jgi:hypothetical protein